MSEEENVTPDELADFLAEVATHIERLQPTLSFGLTIGDDGLVRKTAQLDLSSGPLREEDVEALAKANDLAERPAIKTRICAALGTFSEDLSEVYKPLVKVLLPLSGGGAILGASHIAPITVAIAAIVIARMGIAAYCL